MGKSSKKSTPSVIGGGLTINGNAKASTTYDGKNLVSHYNMSPYETQSLQFVENEFLKNIPKLNVFSDDVQKNLQSQVNAYKNQGIKTINDTYTPMIQDLQENVASRFGNLDNSIFMDNLNNIESKRADAISDLAQDVTAKQNDLINEQLMAQYDYLNYLTTYQNNIYSNMYNALNHSKNNSNIQYVQQETFNPLQSLYNTGINTLTSVFPF